MVSDIDVIIVAHNSGALLAEAVASAVAEAGEERVWVVDAESVDGSVEAATSRFPSVHVLPVPNRGFSASNNRGIAATSDAFVLLLNPDAVLERGAIAVLRAAMDAVPHAGIVGPAVRDADGSVQAGSFGRFPSLLVRVGIAMRRVMRRFLSRPDVPRLPRQRRRVDWVTGACMLVRRTSIDAVGVMDERFFLYYEDIEWCHRMRDHGWQVLLEPTATAVHHLGKSGGGPRSRQAYRESFERYCDLYGLWGLRLASRLGLALRRGER